jgi:hypothetical protein
LRIGLLLLGLAGVVATVPAQPVAAQIGKPSLPEAIHSIEVRARPITQFRSSFGVANQLGKLEFRGGLVLTSPSPSFGGWSGIVIEPDGRRFLAISDEGSWLSGEITYQGKAPAGIVNARIGPIRAIKGRELNKKRDLDAEGLTLLSGDLTRGTVLVSFERNHRIGVFPVSDGQIEAPVRYLKLPPEARQMRPNEGIEAVAVLNGGPLKGSIVAFSERFPGDPARHTGWIWVKDVAHRLSLVDHGGFAITDATSLTDGTLLILERRFRWTEGVKMRMRRVAAADVKPGALLDGEVLLEADLASEIDNMEGLAAHRGPAGETVLTIISDNNFNTILQRNLLLQFTLTDSAKRAVRD